MNICTSTLTAMWLARRFDLLARNQFKDAHEEGIVEEELEVGKRYYIRTLNFTYVGELVAIRHDCLVLIKASWVAEDDRFSNTLKTGSLREVEPYPPKKRIPVSRYIISDVCEWDHDLPDKPK